MYSKRIALFPVIALSNLLFTQLAGAAALTYNLTGSTINDLSGDGQYAVRNTIPMTVPGGTYGADKSASFSFGGSIAQVSSSYAFSASDRTFKIKADASKSGGDPGPVIPYAYASLSLYDTIRFHPFIPLPIENQIWFGIWKLPTIHGVTFGTPIGSQASFGYTQQVYNPAGEQVGDFRYTDNWNGSIRTIFSSIPRGYMVIALGGDYPISFSISVTTSAQLGQEVEGYALSDFSKTVTWGSMDLYDKFGRLIPTSAYEFQSDSGIRWDLASPVPETNTSYNFAVGLGIIGLFIRRSYLVRCTARFSRAKFRM